MRLCCLILAAGAGSRLGGCKQLAPVNGMPLIKHTLATVASIFDQRPFVVLGAFQDEIRPVIEDVAIVIEHADWRDGLGSSIARGVNEIDAGTTCDGVLLLLGDQPRITSSDLRRLVSRFDGHKPVAAYYGNNPGVPAIFPASLFGELSRLRGDQGAKSILLQHRSELVTVPMPSAAEDIDNPADLSDFGRYGTKHAAR